MTLPQRHHSTFEGTIDGVVKASQWLHEVAAGEQMPDATIFAIEVCLEELVTNVVRHGGTGHWGPGADGPDAPPPLSIGLTLTLWGGEVELTIEDNGKPFDVSQAPVRPIRKPLEEIVPGGLGMQLIQSFSDEVRYEPVSGGNRTIVKFLRQREGASTASL